MDAAAHLALVPSSALNDLRIRYAEAQRAYHTWAHIEELFARFEEFEKQLEDVNAIKLAIAYHDAVYDPKRGDNERQSAALLEAANLPIEAGTVSAACAMIEATAKHIPPNTGSRVLDDALYFLDADLSILGADPGRFDEYEEQVRTEYAFVPAEVFTVGRRGVLQRFMDRPALYFTTWGRGRFEAQARANVARAMTRNWV